MWQGPRGGGFFVNGDPAPHSHSKCGKVVKVTVVWRR